MYPGQARFGCYLAVLYSPLHVYYSVAVGILFVVLPLLSVRRIRTYIRTPTAYPTHLTSYVSDISPLNHLPIHVHTHTYISIDPISPTGISVWQSTYVGGKYMVTDSLFVM